MKSPRCLLLGILVGMVLTVAAYHAHGDPFARADMDLREIHDPGEDPQSLRFPELLPEEEGTVPPLVAALVIGHNMRCLVIATAVPALDVPQEPELEHPRSPVAVSCVRTEIGGSPNAATAGPFRVLKVH